MFCPLSNFQTLKIFPVFLAKKEEHLEKRLFGKNGPNSFQFETLIDFHIRGARYISSIDYLSIVFLGTVSMVRNRRIEYIRLR